MKKRLQHIIKGQVQGVGFRPFVFRLAHTHKLVGFVTNTPLGVIIEIEGYQKQLDAFNKEFSQTLPPLAKVSSHTITEIPVINDKQSTTVDVSERKKHRDQEITSCLVEKNEKNENTSFIIKHTREGTHAGHSVLVSPDAATCDDCKNDIFTKGNYRYAYPFTNCTNCGPRYTITHSIPYDRQYTSMACFPLCSTCQTEYENPFDRRFHAQPNACSQCGPEFWLTDAKTAFEATNTTFFHTHESKTCTPDIHEPDIHEPDIHEPDIHVSGIHISGTKPTSDSHITLATKKNLNSDKKILSECIHLLGQGKIIAIKALGGFQLTCNAYDENAINKLRTRKNRPHKAFALMVANIEEAKKIAHITCAAEELLCSSAAPIVLCPKKDTRLPHLAHLAHLAQNIAPDTNKIGIMLAYTPLHKILFHPELLGNENSFYPKALIMTSANAGGEPICIKNRQAIESLKNITDFYLFHNRDILVRIDDSVCLALDCSAKNSGENLSETQLEQQSLQRKEQQHTLSQKYQTQNNQVQTPLSSTLFFRRARGYVPSPIALPHILSTFNFVTDLTDTPIPTNKTSSINKMITTLLTDGQQNTPSVLATGAFLKSTFCLTRNNEAFVSQHIGDLDNLAVTEFYEETFTHLQKLLEIKPEAVICDLHPDFPSTHFAESIAAKYNIPLMRLAHHYAHAYAVLAEYTQYDLSPTLALILDGTGQGTDKTSWGGELLYIAPKTGLMLRLGRIEPIILAGGEIAIKEPWRIAQAMYETCLQKKYIGSDLLTQYPFPWLEHESCAKLSPMLSTMIEKNIQCIESSGCGRLFDAVSALLGLCYFTSYEGQAAIRLEAAQFIQDTGFAKSEQTAQTVQWMPTKYEINKPQSINTAHACFHDCPIHEDIEIKNIKKMRIQNNTVHNSNLQDGNVKSDNILNDAIPIWNLDSHALFAHIVKELADKNPIHEIAQNFHRTLSHSLCKMAEKGMQLTGVTNIVLSGGVMNNETLLCSMHATLNNAGFNVLTPKNMPSGDGAISLGQAFYGLIELQRKK